MLSKAATLPIAISLGDPAGIGPEIIIKALSQQPELARHCRLFAPRPWFEERCLAFGFAAERIQVEDLVIPASGPHDAQSKVRALTGPALGQISPMAGEWAYQSIVAATQAVLGGRARALVTAPIHKEAMHLAGHVYPGHTELLAELAGGVQVRMMLANPELRTVLVTIHCSLRTALERITETAILETLKITEASLRRFGIGAHRDGHRPALAVAGLNPHAGEGGLFGREEIEVVAPAIAAARQLGIDAHGPFAPDTVFMRARGLQHYDAVIALYHDQGLIPVKYLGVEHGVNVTLGLPFVRTSPDHGTAFDIAGQALSGHGVADPSSMVAALRMADQLSRAASSPGLKR
jgi:4-hydroxythreonine-4-phosphate dehydrogenase